jgi:DNA-binding XRE family transcriptional regulator
MNLYNTLELEKQIEFIAAHNEGEVEENLFQQLIEAQTQSIVQIENLCKYIRSLELGIDICKQEETRIATMRKKAENRIESIKKYLTPYVEHENKVEAGTFKLSIRKSKHIELAEGFANLTNLNWCDVKEVFTPDKTKIKKAIESGVKIDGAKLVETGNLQIK